MILREPEKSLPWERNIIFDRKLKEFATKVLDAFSNGSGPPRWMRPERFFSLIDDLERVSRDEKLYFTEREKEKVRKRIESWAESLRAFQKRGPALFERDGLTFDLSEIGLSRAEEEVSLASLKVSRLYGLRKVSQSRIETAKRKSAVVFGSEPISDTIALLLLGFRKILAEVDTESEKVLKKLSQDNGVEIGTVQDARRAVQEEKVGLIKIEKGGRELQVLSDLLPVIEAEKPIIIVRVDLSAETFLKAPEVLKKACQYRMKFYDLNPIEPFRDKLLICY